MEITVQRCIKKEKKRITFILIITRVKVYKSEPHDLFVPWSKRGTGVDFTSFVTDSKIIVSFWYRFLAFTDGVFFIQTARTVGRHLDWEEQKAGTDSRNLFLNPRPFFPILLLFWA